MELTSLRWRKSTRSTNAVNCVEVASLPDGGTAVRDSKLGDDSPVLKFTRPEWEAFLAGARDGEFG